MGTIPLIFGPLEVWLNKTAAISTTTEPDPADALIAAWVKLGTCGNLGYSSDGVRLEVAESLTDIFTDGTTMAVDSRRTEESILLSATLMEDSLDMDLFNMYQMALNNNDVTHEDATTTEGAYDRIDLYQGPHVRKFQFLAKAMSDPDQGDQFPVQLWIPTVRLAGSISSAFVKGDPLMVEASFMALYHKDLGAGNLRRVTSVHT